jgi:hypothetical protein
MANERGKRARSHSATAGVRTYAMMAARMNGRSTSWTAIINATSRTPLTVRKMTRFRVQMPALPAEYGSGVLVVMLTASLAVR